MGKKVPPGQGSLFKDEDEDEDEDSNPPVKPPNPPSIIPPDGFGPRLLDDARREYVDGLDEGTRCSCCGRPGKRYRRPLNAPMARWLIWLVRAYIDQGWRGWCHVNNGPVIQNRKGGGDFAKLKHWRLIEQGPKDEDQDTKDSGFWRPTKKAKSFVYGQITVPKRVHLVSNHVEGFSEEHVTIRESLGITFSYAELMGRPTGTRGTG